MRRVVIEYPTDGLEKIFTKERGYKAIVIRDDDLGRLPEADLIVFSGGPDVHPALYGQDVIPETLPSIGRDSFSIYLHEEYKGIPKVGVCRGAQFLCVKNGGSLWQDVPGHRMGKHYIHGYDFEEVIKTVNVLGDHHQACRLDALGTAWEQLAIGPAFDWVKDDEGITIGPIISHEAFYIPEDKALCVQFHPEWGDEETEDYFWELMERYMS